jgi:putative photosynthetic complex assembly protein 2
MSIQGLLLPVVYALFLWWFTTGIIMAVYDRPRWLTRLYFVLATGVAGVAFFALLITRYQTDAAAIYLTIACGVILWGWQVASYYLGFITGLPPSPQQTAAAPLGQRFWWALRASLYHEVLAALGAVFIAIATTNAPNQWALWVYVALWLMHTSAKLNVFFGVRNFRIELLPRHLHHLGALLTKRNQNAFLGVSLVLAASTVLMLIYRAIVPQADPAQSIGLMAVATLLLLGILEHSMLVIPLPVMLWGWGLRPLPEHDLTP